MTKKEFLKKRIKNINYIDSETCAKCTKCCNDAGCALLPIDIVPFKVEDVIKNIDTGKFSIMARIFSKEEFHLCLQSREIDGDIFQINKPHKKCALLKEKGCLLSDEERPTYALTLIPGSYGYGCWQAIDETEYYDMWDSVQNIMEEVVKYYSSGKSTYQVITESFDTAALNIYKTLINGKIFENYNIIFENSIKFGVDLYEKVLKISISEATTEKIISSLIKLEHDAGYKDYYGSVLAYKLLQFKAYRHLKKPQREASIEDKIQACLKYNELYLKQ